MSRTPWTRSSTAALGLFVAAAALVALCTVRAVRFDPLPEIVPPASDSDPVAAAQDDAMSKSTVLAAVAKDPFRPDRRRPPGRYPLPGEPAPQSATDGLAARRQPPVQPPRLLGTSVLPGGVGLALLEQPGQPARLLRTGETLGPFTLREVERGRVVIEVGDSTIVLELRGPGS